MQNWRTIENRMKNTRKRKRKKPGVASLMEARMQNNKARARVRSSMMAWFATIMMMLLAFVNVFVVVDGFVVSLNMHKHDTRVKEIRKHGVLTARSSGGGAIGMDDGEDICNDDDCIVTTTVNTLDANDDKASLKSCRLKAREFVAGRVSVDTDATITRSVEKKDNDRRTFTFCFKLFLKFN